ncbi:UDP-glycosyltransferase 13 [Sesamum alatum]|uniref:UDP-glycosyltransferase 13 n=1 Tax=Sesamum alatum TaxID=300844 RepID=A0AAE1XT97_9LAMI|nr:UDP-glycosyltransferase 13 [Sesamum alatum]
MSVSNSFNNREYPHLVFVPSGIGNLSPFFRLAVMLASRNCQVTFINIQPQVPAPEFTSFSDHPRIEILDFEMDLHTPSDSTIRDPFIIRFQNINRSLDQLKPILCSSPVNAIFSDFAIAVKLAQISADLDIPYYIVSTSSAQFFSLVAYLPALMTEDPNVFSNSLGDVKIQELAPIQKSSIPPTWMDDSTNYLLPVFLLPNARSLPKVKGVLINTFNWFEPETIAAINRSRVLNSLPPLFPIGPLQSYETQESHHLPWLNEQPAGSVVYVNFGSQEVMSTDQIRELRKGLEICGCNYLWVIKGNEERHDSRELHEFSGDSSPEGNKSRGKIIRGWVDQEKLLAHPAIGGFVNECEWGSVMQAASNGVPMLAWPQHGDQKMNAEIVKKAGFGIWIENWGWGGEKLVDGKEIGRLLAQIMKDLNIKKAAKNVREKAREACEVGGSSEKVLREVIAILTSKEK